ncbi:MAG: T9SS type A sorting domain-containing protein [Paludibacteraceae bacterium]
MVTYKFNATNNGTEVQRFKITGLTTSSINPNDDTRLDAYFSGAKVLLVNNTENNATTQVFDVAGKMIVSKILSPMASEALSIKLPTGVYLVKMSAGMYNNTVKVVVK